MAKLSLYETLKRLYNSLNEKIKSISITKKLPETNELTRTLSLSDDVIISNRCILYESPILASTTLSGVTNLFLPGGENKYGVIVFNDDLTNIPAGTSSNYKITSDYATKIILPDSLKTINNYAIKGNSTKTKLVIPKNVTNISSNCFTNCSHIVISSLHNTYTNQIFNLDCTVTFLSTEDDCFSGEYDVSVLFKKGNTTTSTSGSTTSYCRYTIYTNDTRIKALLSSTNETIYTIHSL